MYSSIVIALAALPFLVGAVPLENSRRNVLSIPLSKRGPSQLDLRRLHAGTHHTMAFVLPALNAEKDGALTKDVYLGNCGEDSRHSNRTPVNATPSPRSMGVRTTTRPLAMSLSQTFTRICGMVPSRLVLPARHILVGHYFGVARPSKLIT